MPRFVARLRERIAHVLVEAAQDFGPAIAQRHLGAEPMEDMREFHGDIAAAGDHDAPRKFLEMKRLVGRDAVFGARRAARVARRMAAGGDQDIALP